MAVMSAASAAVVVGLDVGGTKTNATVLSEDGRFLVDHMVEVPSCVLDGPAAAVAAIDEAMELALAVTATRRDAARAVGLDTRAGQRRRCDLGSGSGAEPSAAGNR
jgi:N-acetylglucosamine kinase-like BadF-type ATPase